MLRIVFYSVLLLSSLAVVAAGGALWYLLPQLPPVDMLREVHLQTPLRVYTSEGALIAEFGEKRRDPVRIEDVPQAMKQAFIAAEDDRFYDHPGVDWMAIARAAYGLLQTREKKQGGSTITMQVARNFFLTPEKTYERKLKEIMLAVKIEQELSKDEIFELYLNKIFLGQRAYGVGAAARVYYGATLSDLTLAQTAMIAGLPKAPSTTNPVTNPLAARERRTYVLGRMLALGFIDRQAFDEAEQEPLSAKLHGQNVDIAAPYVAEMVRDHMQREYGDDAYTAGFHVHTTITGELQRAAERAVTKSLLDYDKRHGYRGAEHHFELPPDATTEYLAELLDSYIVLGGLRPALVIAAGKQDAVIFTRDAGLLTIPWDGLKWARPYINQDSRGATPKATADILQRGDVVRIEWVEPPPPADKKPAAEPTSPAGGAYWSLSQIPSVEGALVSLNSANGAILALVGGFDFNKSKFNRVTQAQRQPGSNFKPFIYSAALEHGYTAASFVNDAPIVFDAPGLESAWRPENYSGRYNGPTRLRNALANSRNLVSIRLLQAMGVNSVLEYVRRFGFDTNRLPHNLSLSLGSGELSLLDVVTGYAVFSNGGFKVEPHFVRRIELASGATVFEAKAPTVCTDCGEPDIDEDGEPLDLAALVEMAAQKERPRAEQVLDPRNAWLMNSLLQGVIKEGTGRRARELRRADLAGKTGTTNDQKDAWFSGFNGRITTTVWVGFDQSKPLGRQETGAQAALPMWIDYMRTALAGQPEEQMEQPPGLVTVRINPYTGQLAGADEPEAIFESFLEEQAPSGVRSAQSESRNRDDRGISEHLF